MARPHLLLVDADPRTLRVLEVNLKNDGFSVTTASDGAAALDQVKVGLPDLIVTETRLPRLDGFELVRRVRELPGGENLPIVFIAPESSTSAGGLSASQNDQVRAVQLSVLDCLVKPVSVRELVTRVNLLLARRTQQLFAAPGGSQLHFSGHLEDVAVIDMLRAFEQGRRSGVLNIEHGTRQATILFKHGKVLDAEQGQLRGEEAVYRTFLWSTGIYDLEFCEIDVPDAIPIGSSALLMEGMRRIDEWGRLAEQLPSSTVVFTVDAQALLQRLAEIPDELNPILRLFDGDRSLMAVIDESPFDDLSTLSVISKMYFEGVLRKVEAPTRALNGTLRALGAGAASAGSESVVRLAAELSEVNVRPHAPHMSADPLPHSIVYCEPPQSVRMSQRSKLTKQQVSADVEPTPEELLKGLNTDTSWPVVALPVQEAKANDTSAVPAAAQAEHKNDAARSAVVAEAEFEEVNEANRHVKQPRVVAKAADIPKPDVPSSVSSLDEGSFFAKGEQGVYAPGSDRAPASRPSEDPGADVELDPRVLSALTVRRGQGLRWAAFIVGAALLLCAYVLFGVFRSNNTRAEPPPVAAAPEPEPAPPPPPPPAVTIDELNTETLTATTDQSSGTDSSGNSGSSDSESSATSASPAVTHPPMGLPGVKTPVTVRSKADAISGGKRPPTARFPSAPDNR